FRSSTQAGAPLPRLRRAAVDASTKISVPRVGLAQQRGQGEVPQPTEGGSDGPLIVRAGRKPAEALQQIELRAIDLDRVDRRPALLPCPPRSGVVYAPLPNGGT